MENEIKSIHNIIKDYRKDEGYGISEDHIRKWINQFAQEDRIFVLRELKHIFSKTYFSKEKIKCILKEAIDYLKGKFDYSTYEELLDNTHFLDVQEEGISQKSLLKLLFQVLKDEFNYNTDNLGRNSQKRNIYIDDVLCTGNTFFNNMKDWITKERWSKLRSEEIYLDVLYIYCYRLL